MKNYRISDFRRDLKRGNGLEGLKKFMEFMRTCEDKKGYILNFFANTDGQEIITILSSNKLAYTQNKYLYGSITLILLNLTRDLSVHKDFAVNVSHLITDTNAEKTVDILYEKRHERSKAVLHCIRAMALLGGEVALNVIKFLHTRSSTCFARILKLRVQEIEEDPRGCYIEILLALLMAKDSGTIEELLSKGDLLVNIFPGLILDRSQLVKMVIQALSENFLRNPCISKTARVNFFTPVNTMHLMSLCQWKKPDFFCNRNDTESEVLAEEEQVKEVVQEFLVTLCTSSKYGIYFKRKPNQSASNFCIQNILYSLAKPWESREYRNLFGEIFAQCPDLLPPYMDSLKYLLNPRESYPYISLMNMIIHIMKCQRPVHWIEKGQYDNAVSCLFPGSPLNVKYYAALVQSDSSALMHVGCSLMLAILRKVRETLESIKVLHISSDIQERIRTDLIKAISNTFSTQIIKSVILSWQTSIRTSPESFCVEKVKGDPAAVDVPVAIKVVAAVDFLRCYNEVLPSSSVEGSLNPLDILKTLHFIDVSGKAEFKGRSLIEREFLISCVDLLKKSFSNRKFDVSTPDLQENILYVLIQTYSQYLGDFAHSSDLLGNSDILQDGLKDIVFSFLARTGLSVDHESIKYWLFYLPNREHDKSEKLYSFFTHVIQKAIESFGQYTDDLIDIKEQSSDLDYPASVFINKVLKVNVRLLNKIPESNKPFSRLVLAAVDLLNANPDPEFIQYFSCVMYDYLHTLYDPGLFIAFLLKRKSVVSNDLIEYLESFFRKPEHAISESSMLDQSVGLSKLLMNTFMAQDIPLALFEETDLGELIKGDSYLVSMQLLLYLRIEFCKGLPEQSSRIVTYADLLKKLYEGIWSRNESISTVVAMAVLEHPDMIASFSPLSCSKCPISSLSYYFIEMVLDRHIDIAVCTYPYYQRIVSELKLLPRQSEASASLWYAVSPFISFGNTILSYQDLEELFLIYMKTSCAGFGSHTETLHYLLLMLVRTTTTKTRLDGEAVELLLAKFLEWNTCKEGERVEIHHSILATANELLLVVMTEEIAKRLPQSDLERLMQCSPPCFDLCCKLVQLYHQHGMYFASQLIDVSVDEASQYHLLNYLLLQEDCKKPARKALVKFQGPIKEWALNLSESKTDYQELFLQSISGNVMDVNDMVDICCQTYEKVVNQKVLPARDISCYARLYEKASEVEVAKAKLPFGDANVSFLHILLSIMKLAYKKDTDSSALLNIYKIRKGSTSALHRYAEVLKDVLSKVDSAVLQSSFLGSKIWMSFVKQILRVALNDQEVGPQMIQCVDVLIDVLYKDKSKISIFDKENGLSLQFLYQLICCHTQYMILMAQRAVQWDKLKESIVSLQQTIVNHEGNVCSELHIPTFLIAYGASMSAVDQRILKLLHTYEVKGAMKRFQPIFWGDFAASHFSGLSGNELFRVPKYDQILSTVESDRVLKTCRSFDASLPLDPQTISGDDRTIYDLRFLLPVMLQLAEKEEVSEIDFAESGAVAVGFTCMSSHCKEVWSAGAKLLKCVVDKMKISKHYRFRLPWLWTIRIICSSLEGEEQRLSSVVVHFLLRVVRLLSNPQDPLYFPVLRSLFIRPVLDLRKVPHFSRLYTSDDVSHSQRHLSFLLNFLSTGIRQLEDYYICKKTSAGVLVTVLLQSPTLDLGTKVQVLEVLEAMVRLPSAARELVKTYDVLTVLPLAVSSSSSDLIGDSSSYAGKSTLIGSVVKVLQTLWNSLFTNTGKRMSLHDRLGFGETNKRKRCNEAESDSDNLSDDNSDEEKTSAAKKFKTSSEAIDIKDTAADNVAHGESLPTESLIASPEPVVVEEFLTCLLHIGLEVFDHADPVYATQYLNLITSVLKHFDDLSKSRKRETLQMVALNPSVVKERVYSFIPWKHLQQQFDGHLTDVEEVRLMYRSRHEHFQKWKKEPLSEHAERTGDVPIVGGERLSVLKSALFDLLDVIEE